MFLKKVADCDDSSVSTSGRIDELDIVAFSGGGSVLLMMRLCNGTDDFWLVNMGKTFLLPYDRVTAVRILLGMIPSRQCEGMSA